MNDIECPRCESRYVTEIKPSKSSLKEFFCKRCDDPLQRFEKTYFQYDEMDGTYSWPADVMYKCHEDDLAAVRAGKIAPEII